MTDVVRRYFDAWNAHDAAAVVATFAPDGTYEDSASGGALRGDAIGAYAAQLWNALPDLRFDFLTEDAIPGGAAAQWMMYGTNRGSMRGLPPTGKSVVLPGADFIRVGPQGITSVRGYFDPTEMPRQLGLSVITQPTEVGPFQFGTSVRVGGAGTAKPGAFSVTVLRVRDASEIERVREYSRAVAAEMPSQPGFIGLALATVGDRMMTFSAWDSVEAPRRMMREGTHKAAVPAFFNELSLGGWTSVWAPVRINPHWIRCTSCGQMEDSEKTTTCRCGAPLPPPAAYF